jgi:hypothetical protein
MGQASTKTVFVDIVQGLLAKDINSSDHDFWDELWKTVLPGTYFEYAMFHNTVR